MSEQLERFITLLKGIFELDKSDLDFGIYRIMNIRKKEIEKFLTEGLPLKVQEALKPFATDTAAAEARIKEIEMQLGGSASIAALPQTLPMVKEYADLKATLAKGVDLSGLEADVYSHLYSFFNRYYEEGDFISKRRYKEGVYAIPYEGEEVKLYWANQDQYYIKTSENFKDYTFVAGDYTIHFKLVDATTEQNNNKEAADSKRVFMLYTEDPENPELKTFEFDAEKKDFIIRFIFDLPPEKKFDYAADNARKITRWIATNCSPLVTVLLPNISNDPKKPLTLIEKHLKAYVAKNTFDYFIHKDLHKFLSRELDFYIKNEVMHLDDVDTPNEKQVETYLAKIRAIKRVGNILIDFLSSIENFQKKLWLKKKFVVQCDYCITLDRIPEEFYPEIIANDKQREEWVKLCAIDCLAACNGGTEQGGWFKDASGKMDIVKRKVAKRRFGYSTPLEVGFLKENRFLMVDTKFFSDDFKSRLLAAIDDFDKQCDGLLIHSENFQALNILRSQYNGRICNIFIDPPYNTEDDGFLFKDNLKSSSWLTMLNDRLSMAQQMLVNEGVSFTAIGDEEQDLLASFSRLNFSKENFFASLIWEKKKKGSFLSGKIARMKDYILCVAKNIDAFPGLIGEINEEVETYPCINPDNPRSTRLFKAGIKSKYKEANIFKPKGTIVSAGNMSLRLLDDLVIKDYILQKDVSIEGNWRYSQTTLDSYMDGNDLYFTQDLYVRRIVSEKREKILKDLLLRIGDHGEVDFREYDINNVNKNGWGTNEDANEELHRIFGVQYAASYPKPSKLIALLLATTRITNGVFCGYFAGSGTTAHAVISLNRKDAGSRKYVLVESEKYFDELIVPRIKKIIFARDWENGFPKEIPSIKGNHIIEESKKVLKNSDGEEDLLSFGQDYKGTEFEENPEWQEDNPFNGVSHCFKYMTLESYEDALSNVVLPSEDTTGHLIARFGDEYLVKYMLDLNTVGSVLNLKAFADPFSYKLKVTEKNETKEVNVDLMETFNYLIGLTVEKLYALNTFTASPDPQGEYEGAVKLVPDKLGNYTFRQVEGKLPDGKRCLIIWRNVTENLTESNAALDAYFLRYRINPADREYDIIYVNGDNNLENLKTGTETWKVQMIEPEFKKRMFEEE